VRQVKDEHSYVKKLSRCKNVDVKGKLTSRGSKTVSDVGSAHDNTVIAYEIRKFRARWRKENRMIRDIIQLGKELGHLPTWLDLFCRFDRRDLASVSDILHRLM
jgi:hypothetical protein